ncbi:MAG: methyltransferase domain-containing protein [Acetobacteraceae bacterium]
MAHETLAPIVDLLQRIPLSARVVLDLACGRGDLLGAYRLMNPTARLLGIEKDPVAAVVARRRIHEVAVADIERDQMPFDLSGGVDCIIYSMALEHQRDPWAMIQRHRELLTPNGMMLMCLPNMEHWSFANRLLRGTWDYEQSGLLDRSHVRWFSRDATRRGLVNAGLIPCDVHPRIFDQERAASFAEAMKPALTTLGIDPDEYQKRAAPLQYVWRVRRQAQQRVHVAGNMLAPVGGVSHVRVLHPLQAIGTDPTMSVQVADRIDEQVAPNQPKIFILHRPALSGQQGHNLLRALRGAGWLVITEFDDHPDFFEVMQDKEQLTFRGVHAVQTSTPALAEVLRQRNPEVAIFPNSIVSLPEVRNFLDPRCLTVFFGALNREHDWRDFMPAINAVVKKVGDRLRFQVVHDKAFFDALETGRKLFTPTCDYDTYMKLLGESEISLMPLQDNDFNRAKSDLKFIEAGACRVTPLASAVVYADSIKDGRTGLLFRTPQELQARLLRLVAMPDLARQIGDAARRYVSEERMLAYQVAPRIAWYRSLWARRESLTSAIDERLAQAA